MAMAWGKRSTAAAAAAVLMVVAVLAGPCDAHNFNITNACNRTITLSTGAGNWSIGAGTTVNITTPPAMFFTGIVNVTLPAINVPISGCVAQAGFKNLSALVMGFLIAITTPLGIGIGIGIATTYNENSPKALIVQGVFDSISRGILVYMALVDLIAADFLSKRMRTSRYTRSPASAGH